MNASLLLSMRSMQCSVNSGRVDEMDIVIQGVFSIVILLVVSGVVSRSRMRSVIDRHTISDRAGPVSQRILNQGKETSS